MTTEGGETGSPIDKKHGDDHWGQEKKGAEKVCGEFTGVDRERKRSQDRSGNPEDEGINERTMRNSASEERGREDEQQQVRGGSDAIEGDIGDVEKTEYNDRDDKNSEGDV